MRTSRQIEIVITTVALVMVIGTLSYHALEGWGYIDSFYFTGITMTTIGYGDMHPTTPLSKIFTVFFAFGGVGVSLFALSLIATGYFERRERLRDEWRGKNLVGSLKKAARANRKELARRKRAIIDGSNEQLGVS